jgi:hypothetical protein
MATPFYHAAIPGGPTGISFQIGQTTLFLALHERRLYVIDDPRQLLMCGPVAPALAAVVQETLIEPRLARLAADLGEGL